MSDLSAGDHFAGMPDEFSGVHHSTDADGEPREYAAERQGIAHATGDAVIDEISAEIEAGNAHLMTRNELVEFIDWWVNHDRLNANEVIALAMEHGATDTRDRVVILDTIKQELAKEFFIEKGYE